MHGLKKKKEKALIRARGWIIHGLKNNLDSAYTRSLKERVDQRNFDRYNVTTEHAQ